MNTTVLPTPGTGAIQRTILVSISVVLLLLVAAQTRAALVAPSGYTNDFSAQPPAADWATITLAGGGGDTYDMDADAAASIVATNVTTQTTLNANNPAQQLGTATWSSTGFFVQTRPTGNRATALLAKFVNDTGSNATQVGISYLLTIAGTVSTEDANKGTRVYYSLTGLANSWNNIDTLNNISSTAGSSPLSASLSINWSNGASLYFLWIDDNNNGGTDMANEIDNFSLRVTEAVPPAFITKVTTPANNSTLLAGNPITTSASVGSGVAPFTVQYFTNSGAGNMIFASAGSAAASPFSVSLGTLPPGFYNIYAVVTDSTSASTNSTTNSFVVANTIAFALTAPANNASFDEADSVTAQTTLSGGTAPYSVQFFVDNIPTGSPVTSAPFDKNFGPIIVGDHTIKATVTDSRGWVSNSAVSAIHITGATAASLLPTNGTAFNFGRSITLTSLIAGGTAPYAASFYVNGQLTGSASGTPYTNILGVLPVGNYTSYVFVTDSSLPVQQDYSATNIFTVVPNLINVALTSPTNGQAGTAGAAFPLSATASVGAPLTIASVRFFVDGVSVGVDNSSPFTGTIGSPTPGAHLVYAAATDSLGRTNSSATNTVNFTADPLANDNFANRFALTTPAHITAFNEGASVEGNFQNGEPQFGQNPGGGFFLLGATLWWKWTAPFSGTVTIDTFGSDFDTFLGVYTGTAVNALTTIAQNNDAPDAGVASLVTFTATAGTEYQVQVGGPRAGFNGPAATGTIKLNLSMPPFVAITNPIANSTFLVGSNFEANVTAGATAAAITNVSIYRGSTLLGSADNPPYNFLITNAPPGSNSLYAVATDAIGQVGTSVVVRVLVANIGITITSPVEDQILPNTAPITISAFTIVPGGSITEVNFFVDGQLVGTDNSAPFSVVWSNLVSGSHRLTATGLDNLGNSYVASPVNIGVGATLIASNSVWKYFDNGTDPGPTWFGSNFDDSSWGSGPAPLGYSDSNGRFPLTTNTFGPDENSKFPAIYYRQSFVVSDVSRFASVTLNFQRDDGVVLYLNGVEIARNNMPTGEVTYTTFASQNAGDDGGTTFTLSISPSALIEGVNVLAAEVHQDAVNSSDIWFVLDLNAVPFVIHNLFPTVAISNPTNDQYFVAPSSITIEAAAADEDGSITNVEFFYDNVKIGSSATSPYSIVWNNPPVGAHIIKVVATDNEDGKGSAQVPIVVYDAASHPVVAIVSPPNGAIMEGPTNLLLTAEPHAIAGITNVQFFANGEFIGQDATAPYTVTWPSMFLSNGLSAVAYDSTGASGASPVISVTITIPPTNTVAPTLVTQIPLAFATVTNLTNIALRFSELVLNVDASDLLINGEPATGVTGSGSNYVFTFPQPPYGKVEVTFANGHGITDYGYPENLPFVETLWEYDLIDRTLPFIAARTPATNAFLTTLTEVAVTFSEVVTNVDATDLLVNGTPGFSLSGGGSNYVFSVIQPPSGNVSFTWALDHGIVDLGSNTFNRSGPGATWTATLDSRTVLVASNSTWRFIKGLAEASIPTNAWRQIGFDDSSWSNAPAPFFYGDPYTNATISGTLLSDMRSNYSSIYLRTDFVITNRTSVTNLLLRVQSDDGFIAWLNGMEILRYNAPNAALGEVPYNGVSSSVAGEPNNAGASYLNYILNNAITNIVNGTNIFAIHAFNDNLTNGTDFGFNAYLYTFLSDASISPPRIAFTAPAQGDVFALTNVTITFSEGVTNVDASDLLINGVPAAEMTSPTNTIYTFSFPQPAYGTVNITWASGHGIMDFDLPAKPFDGNSASAKLTYTLVNFSAPTITARLPAPSTTLTGLTSITITFSEPVAGVDASDLLVSGAPATGVSAVSISNYVFTFPQPGFGAVTVRWATNHGIQDLEVPANDFDPSRPNHTWNYNLIDPVPAVAITTPADNAFFLEPASFTLRATAADNDGTIAHVDFYQGVSKIAELTGSSPYSLSLSNVELGTYTFRAVAIDNSGLMGTSAPVVINVVTSLPIVLIRGPYLLSGSSTGGMVRWRTDQFSDGVVHYGTDLSSLTNIAIESTLTNNHIVRIAGLQPGTKYFYSIGSGSQTVAGGTNVGGADFWFNTAPIPGTPKPTRFWVLGDPGTANANQRAVRDAFYNYAETNQHPADIWLMLGDNAYNVGSDSEHQGAVFDMYPTTLRNLFLWPVLGNHESSQSYTATEFPYLDIFSTPKNGEAGGVPSGNPKYYSFDYANIHFVGLDSMTSTRSATSPMAEWLKDDLATSTQTWTVVYFHHPPYTKGSHNSDAETDLIEVRQNILPILETYGVDLVLSGHSHCYERSYLLNGHYGLSTTLNKSTMFIDGGDGREESTGAYRKTVEGEGTVYSVAGSSGQATGGSLNHPAHFLSLNELGSVIVDVVGNRLDMKFLNSGGIERDHLTLLKRETVYAPLGLVINGNGTVSGATNGEVLLVDGHYTLVATPAPGSIFTGWSGNVTNTEATLDFVMTSNLMLVANFAPVGTVPLASITLGVQGDGSIAGAINGQLLEVGQTYTITALPGDGSVFANWSGGIVSSQAALTFVMHSNLVLIAHFVDQGNGGTPFQPNQLTLIIEGNGTVAGATNGQFLQLGSNYTLQATAGAGSVFANWSGGVVQSSALLNFTMQPNLVIIAHFVEQGSGTNADQLTLVINGEGTVTGATNGQTLQIGQSYALSAVPETGWLFADWSGGVTETSPALTFVMQSNLVVVANFIEAANPEPFAPMAGVFHGLFFEENFTDVNRVGFFMLNVRGNGRYGGTLQFAGQRGAARGSFAPDGKATNMISRAGTSPLRVIWEASLNDPDVISGTVSDGHWVAPLYGDRSVFTSANPAPQAGKYTLIIPGAPGSMVSPAGDGYGTVKIAANGNIRFVGKLADGTTVNQNVPISKNGYWPVYDSLYGGDGVLLGWLHFADDGVNDVAGTLRWIKPSLPKATLYPEGFVVSSEAVGSLYTKPTGFDSVLQISDGLVILMGGNLPDSSNPVSFGPKSKLVNSGPNSLKLIFTPASGLFRGTFKEAGTTQTIPLKGAVLQRQNVGSGYAPNGDQSGWMFFQAAPSSGISE